jgi:hypothetical protein
LALRYIEAPLPQARLTGAPQKLIVFDEEDSGWMSHNVAPLPTGTVTIVIKTSTAISRWNWTTSEPPPLAGIGPFTGRFPGAPR